MLQKARLKLVHVRDLPGDLLNEMLGGLVLLILYVSRDLGHCVVQVLDLFVLALQAILRNEDLFDLWLSSCYLFLLF